MDDDREERVRRRAYELWEGEGSPEGRHVDHWQSARQEIEAEDTASEARRGADTNDNPSLVSAPEDEDAEFDEPFPDDRQPSRTVLPKDHDRSSARSPQSDPGSPGGTSGTGGTNHDQDG